MNEPTNIFGGFSGEGWFAATLADLGGDVLHQDASGVNGEHFAHELVSCGSPTADVTLKHVYRRFR